MFGRKNKYDRMLESQLELNKVFGNSILNLEKQIDTCNKAIIALNKRLSTLEKFMNMNRLRWN